MKANEEKALFIMVSKLHSNIFGLNATAEVMRAFDCRTLFKDVTDTLEDTQKPSNAGMVRGGEDE